MTKNNTELLVMNKIDDFKQQLSKKREDANKTYPLQSTLRAELRKLKDTRIGELEVRLHTIMKLKYNEYCSHHEKRILEAKQEAQDFIKEVEENFNQKVEELAFIVSDLQNNRDAFPSGVVIKNLRYELEELASYYDGKRTEIPNTFKLKMKFLPDRFSKEVLLQEFNDKYGKSFDEAKNRIASVQEAFDESVLFGDLEMVKQIYSIMKEADAFLNKVSNIEVQ